MVSLFSKTVAVAALIGGSVAKDVACAVGGVQQSIVDLDTGSCSFNIPASQPAIWEYSSPEDYTAEFYFAPVVPAGFFNGLGASPSSRSSRSKTLPQTVPELCARDSQPFLLLTKEMRKATWLRT